MVYLRFISLKKILFNPVMALAHRRKVFISFVFLFAFCFICGFFIRHNPIALEYFSRLTLPGLFIANALSLFLGFPLSSIFDILIFSKIGSKYLFIAPILASFVSILQILCMRHFFDLSKVSAFSRSSSIVASTALLVKKPALIIFLLRSIPIAPFIVSSFIISNFYSIRLLYTFLISCVGLSLYYLYFYCFFLAGQIF